MSKSVFHRIKVFSFIGFLFLLYAAGLPNDGKHLSPPSYEYGEYILGTSSVLKITGKTNINVFFCSLQSKFSKESFSYRTNPNTPIIRFANTVLKIPTKEMDCRKKIITKDLHKTLEADEFPFITIELKEVLNQDYYTSDPLDNQDVFLAKINITITDVSRSVSIPVSVTRKDTFSFRISGSTNIKLSDFGIQAPKAMMGLIKIKNTIDIEFDLEVILINEISKCNVRIRHHQTD